MNRPEATLGLRHVALQVRDLEACERFYTELLGMRVEWRPDPDNVYLTSGTDNLALHRIAAHTPTLHNSVSTYRFMLKRIEQVDAWHVFLQENGVSILKARVRTAMARAASTASTRWQCRTIDLPPTSNNRDRMNSKRPHTQHAASHPVGLTYVQHMPQATQALLGEIHFGTSPALPNSTLYPAAWVGMPLLDARRILNCGRVNSRWWRRASGRSRLHATATCCSAVLQPTRRPILSPSRRESRRRTHAC